MLTCYFEDGHKALLRHLAVGCIILKDDKILLTKRAEHLVEGGKWCLPGGFLNRDESIIDAARREVYEETSWEVGDMTLLCFRDKPEGPNDDRQNISFIYFAPAKDQTGQPDDESTDIQWFPLDKLPGDSEMAYDHTGSINLYKSFVSEKIRLPVLL